MAQYNTPQALRPLENLICDFAYSNGYERCPSSTISCVTSSTGSHPVRRPSRTGNTNGSRTVSSWNCLPDGYSSCSGNCRPVSGSTRSGDLFMALSSRGGQQAHGQFFTPVHICDLMVQCTTDEKTTGKRMSDRPAEAEGCY